MAQWLVKEEPEHYGYDQLEKDGKTVWAGVRNPLAQKHLRDIRRGDRIFYYHTGKEKAVVAIAKAASDAYPDPDDASGKLFVVDVVPEKRLTRPVTLAEIKADKSVRVVSARPHVAALGHAGHRRGVGADRRRSAAREARPSRSCSLRSCGLWLVPVVASAAGSRSPPTSSCPGSSPNRKAFASAAWSASPTDAAGTGAREFRIAGIYEPTPDPSRLGQVPREVRLHLPDLLELTRPAGTSRPAPSTSPSINVALVDPDDARAVCARRQRADARRARAARAAMPPEPPGRSVVLERFHLAIAIVTIVAATVFLLALTIMLVDERRETVGVLRLIGLPVRRILVQILLEGLLVAGAGAVVRPGARRPVRRARSTRSSSGATTRRWSSCASRATWRSPAWRSPCRSAPSATVAGVVGAAAPQRPAAGPAMNALGFAWRSLVRQPARAALGILGVAAVGALLFDMLLLSRGPHRVDARSARSRRAGTSA